MKLHLILAHVALALLAVILLVGCAPITPTALPQSAPPTDQFPTLDHFWSGSARFQVDVEDTGLPMGESDTIILADGTWRSYVHASDQSLGVRDQCGNPVEFPGCLVTFTSTDGGQSFAPALMQDGAPICQMACARCPCDSRRDHIDQQQYPRVATLPASDRSHEQWLLTYEYRANTIVRRSTDGLNWSEPVELPMTGIWQNWLMPCATTSSIGLHPYTPKAYDCLTGSPPGIFIDRTANPPELYLFVGLGQNPSGMGCYRGAVNAPASLLRACNANPLFTGAVDYGPLEHNPETNANAHFDFRTISSAEVIQVGSRYYLFYEGVRGPGPGDHGDTQFLLGLARSQGGEIDGAWELYPENPILLDLPGNVGVGHADVVISHGETFLYTTLDGRVRSRLRLVWE
jgi:hypothetical protein